MKRFTLCLWISLIWFTVSAQLTVNQSFQNPTCAGASNGQITLTPSGCGTAYSYQWTPNVSSTNVATNLPAGNYSILVTPTGSSGGGTTVAYETNFQNTSQWTLAQGSTNRWAINNIYVGGSIFFGFITIPSVPLQPAFFSNPNQNYLHPLSSMAANAGVNNSNYQLGSSTQILDATMNLDFSTAGLSNVEVSFYRTGGRNGLSLIYSTNSGATWLIAQSYTDNPTNWTLHTVSIPEFENQPTLRLGFRFNEGTAQDPAPNHYHSIDELKVTGTSSIGAGCNPITINITLTDPSPSPPANVNIVGGSSVICQGSSVTLQADLGLSNVVWNTGHTGSQITVNQAGTYSYTATNAQGCNISSNNVDITVSSASTTNPNVIVQGGSTTICQGSSVVLEAESGITNVQWNNGSSGNSITINQAGTFSYTGINSQGCNVTSNSVQISIDPNSQTTPSVINSSGTTVLCQGASILLQAQQGLSSVVWSNGTSGNSINVNTAGTYSYTAQTQAGCTLTSQTVTITLDPLSNATYTVNTAGGVTEICPNSSLVLNANQNLTNVVWSNGLTGNSITVNQPGTYSYTAVNASGCSVQSQSIDITLLTGVSNPSVNINGPSHLCIGGSVTLTAQAGFTNVVWNNGITGPSLTVNQPGLYSYTAISPQGCEVQSNPVNITQDPYLVNQPNVIVPGGSLILCNGSDKILLAEAGLSNILWNNGMSGSSILITQPGVYFYGATTPSGCQVTSQSVEIVADNLFLNPPPVIVPGGATQVCAGTPLILEAVNNVTNVIWNNGQTGNSINASQSGTYLYNAISQNGCPIVSQSIFVTIVQPPTADFTAIVTGNLSFEFTSLASQGNTSYTWNFGDGNTANGQIVNHTYAQPGNYIVTHTVTNNCGTKETQKNVIASPQSIEILETAAVNVFPNPATDIINIQNPEYLNGALYSLVDLKGRILKQINSTSFEEQLNIQTLQSGVYILLIQTTRLNQTIKIIKN